MLSQKTKIITLLGMFFLFCADKNADAQVFGWAKRFAPSSAASNFSDGYCNAIDASGNVYSAGIFFGTVDFDPNAGVANITYTPAGGRYWVSKLTSAGNYVWAKSFGGGSITPIVRCMTTDPAGNVYIAGIFSGNTDFDPGAATFILNASGSFPEGFLLKLSSAGNFMWAIKFNSSTEPTAVFTDASNNVYVVGFFGAVMDFDPGAGVYNLTPSGSDAFITRYTAAGAFGWAKKMGGAGVDYGMGGGIDAAGNLYVSGFFEGTADFDPGAGVSNLTAASAAGNDAFVTKLNSAGNFTWARRMGGTASSTSATKVDIDGSGNVYLGGQFGGGTADFDPGTGVFNLTPTGPSDIFICKLSSTGNFAWAKRIGGATAESCNGMNVSGAGNVYLGGDFEGTVDFDPGTGTQNRTSAGNSDMFIMMLNTSGNYMWVWTMGSAGDENLASLALDGSNFIYSTGAFFNTVDFNGTSGTFNLTATARDAFVHKITITSPLPIELLSFEAIQNKTAVDITWQTATETNNDFFTIEKSKDGDEFEETGKINGAGNSTTALDYSFTDEKPFTGISYYRLKQTDFNGEFSYSKTIAVRITKNTEAFSVYYNATDRSCLVNFYTDAPADCLILISDISGRILKSEKFSVDKGINTLQVSAASLANGIYVIEVQSTFQERMATKIVVE